MGESWAPHPLYSSHVTYDGHVRLQAHEVRGEGEPDDEEERGERVVGQGTAARLRRRRRGDDGRERRLAPRDLIVVDQPVEGRAGLGGLRAPSALPETRPDAHRLAKPASQYTK